LGALLGGVGAAPLSAIGAIVGGFIGEEVMKNLSKKIMSALGLKDIKFNKNKKDGNEVEGVNGNDKNITPQKNENLNVADMISNFDEDSSKSFTLGQNNTSTSSGGGGAGVTEEKSRSIPVINSSDSSNPYVLAATVNYGI